jgi:hypothetical protein
LTQLPGEKKKYKPEGAVIKLQRKLYEEFMQDCVPIMNQVPQELRMHLRGLACGEHFDLPPVQSSTGYQDTSYEDFFNILRPIMFEFMPSKFRILQPYNTLLKAMIEPDGATNPNFTFSKHQFFRDPQFQLCRAAEICSNLAESDARKCLNDQLCAESGLGAFFDDCDLAAPDNLAAFQASALGMQLLNHRKNSDLMDRITVHGCVSAANVINMMRNVVTHIEFPEDTAFAAQILELPCHARCEAITIQHQKLPIGIRVQSVSL